MVEFPGQYACVCLSCKPINHPRTFVSPRARVATTNTNVHPPPRPLTNHAGNLRKSPYATRAQENPDRNRAATTTTTSGGGGDGVPAEQQPARDPERGDVPPVGARAGRRHLAGDARRRHGVRALLLGAGDRVRGVPPPRLPGGPRRRVLPRKLPPLVLPRRHVRPHRRPLLLHRLRLRRHQQGRRRGRLRQGLQGVQARRLLQLAAEADGEQQELEQDQELPPGLQGLQETAGQELGSDPVLQSRSLPSRVRMLQAAHQLQLHLHRRYELDDDAGVHDDPVLGPGLQNVEQRRHAALLQLPVVQGRRGGHPEAGLEARRRRLHRLPRLHRHRLLPRLLRVQEQPEGQPRRLPRRGMEGRIRLIRSIGRSICTA